MHNAHGSGIYLEMTVEHVSLHKTVEYVLRIQRRRICMHMRWICMQMTVDYANDSGLCPYMTVEYECM
jgi:hypothetical protein